MNIEFPPTTSFAGQVGLTGIRPIVKLCGIKQPEHALLAANQGADMIGLVFAESRRQVSAATAMQIAKALRVLQRPPLLVGVFVNESLERAITIAREVNLGALQLSGDESPEYVAKCARHYPVIKAVRFSPGTTAGDALETLHAYREIATQGSERIRFLVDAYRAGEYGGTGRVGDWSLAAALASRYDIVLAGGLNPSNVACAIEAVSPWGVDVSSGVENDGTKDPRLITAFLAATKQTPRKDLT